MANKKKLLQHHLQSGKHLPESTYGDCHPSLAPDTFCATISRLFVFLITKMKGLSPLVLSSFQHQRTSTLLSEIRLQPTPFPDILQQNWHNKLSMHKAANADLLLQSSYKSSLPYQQATLSSTATKLNATISPIYGTYCPLQNDPVIHLQHYYYLNCTHALLL